MPHDLRPHKQARTNVLNLFNEVPHLTEYLSVPEIQRLREQKILVTSGGTIYQTTVANEIPGFGRVRLDQKSLGESADKTVDNLKKLDDYLRIAINMGPGGGNRLLRSLMNTAMTKVPERDRLRAWEMCLSAVMCEKATAADSGETGVIQPSGELRHQGCEKPLRASAEYVSALVQLTQLIPQLPPRDCPAAWDQVYLLLGDPRLNLSKDQKVHLASHLAQATQSLWNTDHRLRNEDAMSRFNAIMATINGNTNGQPFSLEVMKRLMSAIRHFSRDDARNSLVLDLLQNTDLNLYLGKENVEKFLTEISLLIWSMGYPTTAGGYIPPTTRFPQPALAQASAFGETSHTEFAGKAGKSSLTEINADAEKNGDTSECELVRAIKHLFDTCASLRFRDQVMVTRALFARRPPQQDMAAFDILIRAALISSPKGENVSLQAVQTHRARMLRTVLSAAEEVFSEQDSAARQSNWFRPRDRDEGFFRFPAFISALVRKSCEMISVLPDHAEKLPLLEQLVDMLSWVQISTKSVSTPLRMVENQLTAIPPDFPGRRDLYAELTRRNFVF